MLTNDPTTALVVSFPYQVGAASAARVDFTATDPSTNHGYSLLGLVTGRDSISSDEETGSFKYAILQLRLCMTGLLTVMQLSLSRR